MRIVKVAAETARYACTVADTAMEPDAGAQRFKSPLRNYLHPRKAAERSGALIEQRCAKRRAMPRSVLGAVSKTGGARAIRFGTPEKLCEVLDCQPSDLFAFENPAADVAAVAS
jgi:DNA-binding Xre family transcriptional regulator